MIESVPSFPAIRGNAGNELPHEIVFFDTETTQTMFDDERGKGVVNHLQFGVADYVRWRSASEKGRIARSGWTEPQSEVFTTIDDFWDLIERRAKAKSRLWVIAHNFGGFDFDVLGATHPLTDRGWEIKKLIIECPPFVIDLRKGTSTIRLIDSLNYTRAPLADLGRAIGIEKGEDPGVNRPMEERLEYCRNDVRILRTFMLSYIDFIQEHDLGNFAMTGASQAMNAWRHRFAPKYVGRNGREHVKVFPTQGPEYEGLERKAYFAGRTGCDFIGTRNERITCYDINSLFPSVMVQHRYPYALKGKGTSLSLDLLHKYLDQGLAVIATVRLKTDQDWYPIRGERVLFPTGEFETTLCTGELRLAIDHGHIVEIGEYQTYKTADLFTDYVTHFYEMRQRYKAEGNSLWEYICKVTFLNSLYGKFGQKTPEWVPCEQEIDTELFPHTFQIVDGDTGKRTYYRHLENVVEQKLDDDRGKARNAFVAIAAHVTSYARVELLKGMLAAGRENVLYYDTDSLFVTDAGRDALEDAGMVSATELGKFKYEKDAPGIEIRGAKDYVFGETIKIKGVRARSKYTNRIDDSTFEQDKFRSFRGSVFHNSIGIQYVFREVKRLSRKYTKGRILSDGRVVPWRLTYPLNAPNAGRISDSDMAPESRMNGPD